MCVLYLGVILSEPQPTGLTLTNGCEPVDVATIHDQSIRQLIYPKKKKKKKESKWIKLRCNVYTCIPIGYKGAHALSKLYQ
jgi:hypothetical protein